MKLNWRRIAFTLGLVGCLGMLAPACIIRARATPPVYVVDTEPPPPRYKQVAPRPGYVWIRGRYVRRGNRWVWKTGRWERARSNQYWVAGSWERRGNRWHWVEGRWARGAAPPARGQGAPAPRVRDHRKGAPPRAVPNSGAPAPRVRDHRAGGNTAYPVAPPPAPRAERPGAARRGYVWIAGHYEWRAGQYNWVPGHWERARAGKRWVRGRWEKRGNKYIWVKGRWEAGPANKSKVRDHRRKR